MGRHENPEPAKRPSWHIPWPLGAILSLIGFTAVIAQVVLMRELLVVFYGNELALGVVLANWLLWTALGASVVGRWAARTRHPRQLMACLQTLLALALPLTPLAVRASKSFCQAIPGEILGPVPMFLTAGATLSVLCVVSGGLFAAGSRVYAEATGRFRRQVHGRRVPAGSRRLGTGRCAGRSGADPAYESVCHRGAAGCAESPRCLVPADFRHGASPGLDLEFCGLSGALVLVGSYELQPLSLRCLLWRVSTLWPRRILSTATWPWWRRARAGDFLKTA